MVLDSSPVHFPLAVSSRKNITPTYLLACASITRTGGGKVMLFPKPQNLSKFLGFLQSPDFIHLQKTDKIIHHALLLVEMQQAPQ